MRQSGAVGTGSRMGAVTRACLCGLMLAVAFSFGGCASKAKPGRYTIEVTPTQAVSNQVLVVDMFGAAQEGGFGVGQVKQHFAGGQFEVQRQERGPVTLRWDEGDTQPRRLEVNDPAWTTWIDKGAWFLVIASNAPVPSATGGLAPAEPLILPLDKRRWKTNLIRVELGSSGLTLNSRMEPLPE